MPNTKLVRTIGRQLAAFARFVKAPVSNTAETVMSVAAQTFKWTLWLYLHEFAKRKSITVTLAVTKINTNYARRSRDGRLPIGVYDDNGRHIVLAVEHWSDVWTLAHEIGHYLAYRKSDSRHSEATADDEGRRLVLRLVEQSAILKTLFCCVADEFDYELPAKPQRKSRKQTS
jgi:hypothetical protein